MHSLVTVLVPPDVPDVIEAVAGLLEPFESTQDSDGWPYRWWDSWTIGGRFDGVVAGIPLIEQLSDRTYASDLELVHRNSTLARDLPRGISISTFVSPEGQCVHREEWAGPDPLAPDVLPHLLAPNPHFEPWCREQLDRFSCYLAIGVDCHL
jgi:hypothetical protein